ncbi:MAG: fimbrillin family protein [Bacteroidales bacterium]|nr:fimbrillin family protein [Bacteroidales bacterium]MBQ9702877.1 fimbrillin family protein [Bacteroidales bacterium]
MKKYLFIAAAALVAMAACNKAPQAVDPESELPQSGPAWLYDQSKPVPILFGGQDVTTKASGMIVNDDTTNPANVVPGNFKDIQFGVLGVDITRLGDANNTDTDKILLAGVVGANKVLTADDVAEGGAYPGATAGTTVVTFPEGQNGSYYYPMFSTGKNYTFFAYRTVNEPGEGQHADMTYTQNGTTFYKSVSFGDTDILWAKAEATPLEDNTTGFNAAYVRKAMEGNNFYSTYAPKFNFAHLTAAFKFVVKAYNQRAEDTLDGTLSVTGITVRGLYSSATLNINEGTFQATGNPNTDLEVPFEADPEDPFYPKYNEGNGTPFGTPLFTLPSIDYGTDEYTPEAVVSLALPNNQTLEVVLPITAPADGFEKGKAYQFNVIINSLEEIQIVTTLTDWDETTAAIDLDPIG